VASPAASGSGYRDSLKMVKTWILGELVAVNSMWIGSLSIELRQAIVEMVR